MGRNERDQSGLSCSFVAPHAAHVALTQLLNSLRHWQMEDKRAGDSEHVHVV